MQKKISFRQWLQQKYKAGSMKNEAPAAEAIIIQSPLAY